MSRDAERLIVQRAQRGDAEAFRELVETYKDRLFAFVWRLIRNHHEAEDLCQATFVKAYQALDGYSSKFAFSTWLFTIAYRLTLNQLRRRKSVAQIDAAFLEPAEPELERSLASTEEALRLRNVIWSAVDELSTAQKTAVLLFYREGKSCQEIGQVLGMPAVTVKSHLHRAREKLRQVFDAQIPEDWSSLGMFGDSSG